MYSRATEEASKYLGMTMSNNLTWNNPVWPHTFVSPSAFSRRAVVSYWRKYAHQVLVNRLGGLSLPRKNVVRLTDPPDMTLDVYRGRKTTIQLTWNKHVENFAAKGNRTILFHQM